MILKKNNKIIKQYTELNKRVSNIFKANSVEEAQRRFIYPIQSDKVFT